MKRLVITAMLLVGFQGAFAQKLLDSLQGTWTVTRITTNNKNTMQAGTLIFNEDGKLASTGNHFGTTAALYTTNETTQSIHIETPNKTKTEWEAVIKNGVLYLTSIDTSKKGKDPVIKIVAVRSKG